MSGGYGNTATLASAIMRAVDLGATVINLSEAACAPVGENIDDAAVGQAVRDAFNRNVVVVAAAGNINPQGPCSVQNEVRDPNRPLDEAWSTVHTIASPAWFGDYVLTVGAVTPDARPSDFSLRGPWIDVAAPGEQVISLSPTGGLTNAWMDPQKGLVPVSGTSFAAPYVAGVVALVRSRFPALSAAEVMERVKRTARTPRDGPDASTGYGVVDPVAALTAELPPRADLPDAEKGHRIADPQLVDSRPDAARGIVLGVLGGCIVMALAAIAVVKSPRPK